MFIIYTFANRAVYEMGKQCRGVQAADDNMAHSRCTLDT